jgi:diguanylate cyclase (GGDEF)-like protein
VEELADKNARSKTEIIAHYVDMFLEAPQLINALNAASLADGLVAPDDVSFLERLFRSRIGLFPTVSSSYFGNLDGGLVNSGRDPVDDSRYVIVTDDFKAGTFRKYLLDENGRRTDTVLATVPDFDARTRPWFIEAKGQGGPTWSSIYPVFTGDNLAVAASQPAVDETGLFVGVFGVDVFLGQISAFLKGLDLGTGTAFLLDREGFLVAASQGELLARKEEGNIERVAGAESPVPFIRECTRELQHRLGSLERLAEPMTFTRQGDSGRSFFRASPIQVDGIDWIVVVHVPERDLSFNVRAHRSTGFLLAALVLALSVVLAAFVGKLLVDPLEDLVEAVQSLDRSDTFSFKRASRQSRFAETELLTRVFSEMHQKLQKTLQGLREEIARRKAVEEDLRYRATTDPLTGLANRRHFLERMEEELVRARRYGRSGVVLMADLDRFKSVNDTYGHKAGDVVLRAYGRLLAETVRKNDVAGRLGGEEFGLFLPEADLVEGMSFAERLRLRTEEISVPVEGGMLFVTVSIGLTVLQDGDDNADAPLARADKALYLAKTRGRNRVEAWETPRITPSGANDAPSEPDEPDKGRGDGDCGLE